MKRALCLAAIAIAAPQAHAGISTYFDEDLGAFNSRLLTNTRAAQADFLSAAGTSEINSFEDLARGRRAPFEITFAEGTSSELNGLVTGNPRVQVSESLSGAAFATDGDKYLRISSPIERAVIFTLFRPASAVGFTLTDLGDSGNSLIAVLDLESGEQQRLSIPTSIGNDGAAAFWGVTSAGDNGIVSLTLEYADASISDSFGLDELTIAIPTPGTLAIAGAGLLAGVRRRR